MRFRQLLAKYAWFLLAVLILVGYAAFFRTAEVRGSSMEPTYSSRDLLLMRRFGTIRHGDIVAIYNEQMNEVLCKRVIGIEGDHVIVNTDGLFINDTEVAEEYVISEDWYKSSAQVDTVVPAGELFVMGDNRTASSDSRVLGCMPISDLSGVVIFNVTKIFGLRRDALIRAVAILLVCSLCLDIYKKVTGAAKNKE